MHQCLTCNADTNYNSYILHAMAQPFVAGKLYLRASLQILYLSDLCLAHLVNASEKYSSLTSSMTVANTPYCVNGSDDSVLV